MFTGLVEELGTLASSDGARLVFEAVTVIDGSRVGDSIAVNGCCLTVVELGPGWWAADVVAETLGRTNLGDLQPGDPVNLERPVQVGSRLGGHLVQGHVDAVGTILSPPPDLEVALDALAGSLRGREGLDHGRRHQPDRGGSRRPGRSGSPSSPTPSKSPPSAAKQQATGSTWRST